MEGNNHIVIQTILYRKIDIHLRIILTKQILNEVEEEGEEEEEDGNHLQ